METEEKTATEIATEFQQANYRKDMATALLEKLRKDGGIVEILSGINTLKLFVWDAFCPDYSYGLAFAIAENIEEAQRMVEEKLGYRSDWGPVKEFPLYEPRAFCVSGGG